jgi:uncharacterized alpha-E superfamily protein
VADIFDSYRLAAAWDEMFAQPGQPRPPYAALLAALQPLDPTDLRFRSDQLAQVLTDRGVTYDFAGEERPFPLDLIPRVIDAAEWDLIARTRTWSGEPQPVIEFLLADQLFPRSVVHALGTAEQALAALDPAGAGALRDPARRSLGELRTRLEYADPAALPGLLPELLPTLQRSCVQASEAISARYFSYEHAVTWAQEG